MRRGSGHEHAGAQQHEDQRAEADPVPHEQRVAVGADVLQEPADHDVADAEGDHGGQQGRARRVVGVEAVADGLGEFVQAGQEHRGDREEEGVAGRGLAGVPHEQAGGDGPAGAGDPRDQGQGLREAVEHAIAQVQVAQAQLLPADPVRQPQEHAEDDEHGRRDPQAAELGVDVVLQQQPEDADGQGAQDHVPAHPSVGVGAGDGAAQGSEPPGDDPDDVAPEEDQHGRLGAQLGDRGERGPGVRVMGQQLPDDADVPRGGDREEFRQALHQAEDECL